MDGPPRRLPGMAFFCRRCSAEKIMVFIMSLLVNNPFNKVMVSLTCLFLSVLCVLSCSKPSADDNHDPNQDPEEETKMAVYDNPLILGTWKTIDLIDYQRNEAGDHLPVNNIPLWIFTEDGYKILNTGYENEPYSRFELNGNTLDMGDFDTWWVNDLKYSKLSLISFHLGNKTFEQIFEKKPQL